MIDTFQDYSDGESNCFGISRNNYKNKRLLNDLTATN